ncbi:MAG: 2Fe-2S iron-sulfur cluster binding domain-containing protein, partial [Limnobacter sp.]|nr:2Fe-2S iron-sulfur cluster binding domain-containing protein [Limnobacter sp.]
MRRVLDLPARRVRRRARAARARAGGAARIAAGAGVRAAADPSAPWRRRLHLRRGKRADRVDRGQARDASAASALRRPGRAVRPAHARAQRRDARSRRGDPAGTRRRRLGLGRARPARTPRAAAVLGFGPRTRARRQARAGRDQPARAGRRTLRRHGRRARVVRVPAGRRLRRRPAGLAGRRAAARFRHAAAARLLHRFGRDRRAVAAGSRARRCRQPDGFLPPRILRPVHAVPGRHREGRGADARARLGHRPARRVVGCDGRRIDLRTRAGGAEPGPQRDALVRARTGGEAVKPIAFELDGRTIDALPGESILEAADRHGVEIPRLCHRPGLRPDGNCRACVVEVDGERTLAASCCRAPAAGMKVRAGSERARRSQRMVVELLLADAPGGGRSEDSELRRWAAALGVSQPRFAPREQPAADFSHPAMAVLLDACIQCGRCTRACREEQANDVIGYAWRGDAARIVFDQGDPMGASSCVGCGECVQACPTGALLPRRLDARANVAEAGATTGARAGATTGVLAVVAGPGERQVDSLCPFCGVGCQLRWQIEGEQIVRTDGRDGPANRGRLCVKGRFGFDYVASPDRLTVPLVRREGVPKNPAFGRVPADWRDQFREASWDEALAIATGGLKAIRDAQPAPGRAA